MISEMYHRKPTEGRLFQFFAVAAVAMIFIFNGIHASAEDKQRGFATPEEAVEAFVSALRSADRKALEAIMGPEGKELIFSGDPVEHKRRVDKFISLYDQKHRIVQEGDKRIITIGETEWPYPIPLVKTGNQWIFDTKAGKEEILNRRIGENELNTVQTLLAIVDAQREYAMTDWDNDGLREYAEAFRSDPGKKNGLFWKVQAGEALSPLGEMAAKAWAEGYSQKSPTQGPIPYHGYYFRILRSQGPHAPGGAFDYVVGNQMIGGFAVVAYPATYGSTGIMTFTVNHRGVVYEKDFGEDTVKSAMAITSFDPDETWYTVEE